MEGKDDIFLSMEEAISAIRMDFCQYPPQTDLFVDLSPLILGPHIRVVNESRYNGLWISTAGCKHTRKRRKITAVELGRLLIDTLAASPPPPELMTEICRLTFLVPAEPSGNGAGSEAGVRLQMGAEGFRCRHCGRCCRELNYRNELIPDDYNRWQALGRADILERVATITRGGRIVSYAIWVEPGTRRFLETCPWLMAPDPKSRPDRFVCSIHDVKPEICQQYPGTRKHARMTGCPGFDR